MYIVHTIAVYLFYFGLFYLIYKNFKIARFYLDSVAETVTSLGMWNGEVLKVQQQ